MRRRLSAETLDTRTLRDTALVGALIVVGLLGARGLDQTDVDLYRRYGELLIHHKGLPTEYPAFSALLFALPLALPIGYHAAFALEMVAVLVTLALIGRRLVPERGWLARFVMYAALGTTWVIFARYDLAPALASFVAVVSARRGRFGTAWAAAAVGAALKVFPVLFLPGFFIAEWRTSGRPPWRRVVLVAAIGGALVGIQSAVAPGTLLTPLSWEIHRGFEYSSLPGTLSLLLGAGHVHFAFAFRTIEVFGPAHAAIGAAVLVAELTAVALVWRAGWRERLGVAEVSVLVLSVVVLGGRSFAPQYLIWLAPLWALWPRHNVLVLTAVLTTLAFPEARVATYLLAHSTSFVPAAICGALRNVAFAVGTLSFARQRLNERAPAVVAPDKGPAATLWHASAVRPSGGIAGEVSSAGAPRPTPGDLSIGGGTSVLDGR